MNSPKLVAHCVVRNEECWIWYALQSVVDYVDEVMVWDTGSTDRTAEIIKTISHPKIKFRQLGITQDETALSNVRQQMLEESGKFDWLMILDGDEVWPNASLASAVKFLKTKTLEYESIVVPTLNCIGDVFHISPPDAGRYHLAGRVGHLNTRFINLKISGLHVYNDPQKLQSYLDSNNIEIHNRDPKKVMFLDTSYLHMTHLTRSQDRKNETNVFWRSVKKKYELGNPMPADFAYPGSFYLPRPAQVPNPFQKMTIVYWLNAVWQTPLRKLKRAITL